MGIKNVSARWTGEALTYVGTDEKGNQIPMGGDNVSPSQLMLMGLAGCTGMDVVSILQKKRYNVREVEIQVIAHQPDQYPKPYHTIEIAFTVKGDNIDPKAVARALQLSTDKYCIVGQTLQKEAKIKTSFEIES